MTFSPLPDVVLEPIVRLALLEDLSPAGDVTVDAVVAPTQRLSVGVRTRERGVVAGLDAALLTLRLVDPAVRVDIQLADGDEMTAGDTVLRMEGPARSILMAERTMLNFIGHCSGIATLAREFVDLVAETPARITCTRKTTPGLRALEKRAARLGGAVNHRFSLSDAVLIKDNHIAAAGGAHEALRRAQAQVGHMRVIEIEVDTLAQLEEVLPLRPHCVLLDNMSPSLLKAAVAHARGQTVLEASGGVRLETVREIAETGVDYISVGAITHSHRRLDVGLDVL